MVQLCSQLGLVEEHPHEALLVAEVRADALEHHGLLEAFRPHLAGEEDLRHSADGDAIEEKVFSVLLLAHADAPPKGARS